MNTFKQPSEATLQKQVDAFNLKFAVGEIVNVKTDFGDIEQDEITHEATIMCGSVTAWLKKHRSYLSDRVSKV